MASQYFAVSKEIVTHNFVKMNETSKCVGFLVTQMNYIHRVILDFSVFIRIQTIIFHPQHMPHDLQKTANLLVSRQSGLS